MAIRSFVLPVTTGAAVLVYTALTGDDRRPVTVYLQNDAANTANPLYIGGDAGVTADTAVTGGFNVPSVGADVLAVPLLQGESIYVASSVAAQKIRVMLDGANVK